MPAVKRRSSSLTRQARARRYLQASMNADFNRDNEPARKAYEDQMAAHERDYPRVREHALAGGDSDFDERLTPGEREHQKHLRRQAGMQEADVNRIRKQLRTDAAAPKAKPRTKARASAGPRAARKAATAGASAANTAAGGTKNTFMYFLGAGLLLCLFYLFVAGKGVNAVTGIVNAFVGAVGAFIQPVDPVAKLQQALGASSSTSSEPIAGVSGATNAGSGGDFGISAAQAASHPLSSSPGTAGALTWPGLKRAIEARTITKSQLKRDLEILTNKPISTAPAAAGVSGEANAG
jgi:uncharacterized MAPEG superfamily protein